MSNEQFLRDLLLVLGQSAVEGSICANKIEPRLQQPILEIKLLRQHGRRLTVCRLHHHRAISDVAEFLRAFANAIGEVVPGLPLIIADLQFGAEESQPSFDMIDGCRILHAGHCIRRSAHHLHHVHHVSHHSLTIRHAGLIACSGSFGTGLSGEFLLSLRMMGIRLGLGRGRKWPDSDECGRQSRADEEALVHVLVGNAGCSILAMRRACCASML
nr:hypothetical protein [Nordella sp. HKS 07]